MLNNQIKNQTFQEPVVHSDFSEYLFTKTGLHLNEEVAKRIDISFRLGNDSIEQDCMDYKEFLLHVFDDIKHIYSINFKEDTVLLDELSLNLKYAEQRCKTNTQLKNPLIEEFVLLLRIPRKFLFHQSAISLIENGCQLCSSLG